MNNLANILINHPEVKDEDCQITDADHKDIEILTKKALKLQEQIDAPQQQIANKKEEVVFSKYIPFVKKMGVYYSKTGTYYNWDTGTPEEIVDEKETWYITVYKVSSIQVIALGFDPEKGAIIYGKYRITINSQKKILKKTFLGIQAIPFFEDRLIVFERYDEKHTPDNAGKIFIKEMFGVDYIGKLRLEDLKDRFRFNKAFENILKECSSEKIDTILKMSYKEPAPFCKLLNLTKPGLRRIKEEGLLDMAIQNYVNCQKQDERLPEPIFPTVGMTETAYIDFLKQCKEWEDVFAFYGIKHDDSYRQSYYRDYCLATTLMNQYTRKNEFFKEGYSFNKFANYVVNETVNQGYSGVIDFIDELADYLSMCKDLGAKPSYDSNFLKQTHDVTARNFKVKLDEIEEKKFYQRYTPYEDSKVRDFWVVIPRTSNDIKEEGNQLHHCVASYIKSIIDGKCLIFFLRKNKKESLVTFKVVEGKAVQIRGAKNRAATKEERDAIEKWVKKTYEKGTV